VRRLQHACNPSARSKCRSSEFRFDLSSAEDGDELIRLERSASDEESIDVRLLCELVGVVSLHAASVDETRGGANAGLVRVEQLTQLTVNLLRLSGAGGLERHEQREKGEHM
jgi:hypothetical protein